MADKRFGRYLVDAELGRGGMSVVYRARDPALDRPVAVKVLHPHLADRPESRARFTREAKAVARLQHPAIVEVYDYAPAESEQAYIVTEYIDGPTLRQFVDAHPLRHAEVAALLMIPVLQALGHAHDAGVVHRDVKPENVMLRPNGTPVLMDFGIAQMLDQDTLTATGTMLGSPAHMAPEVVEGEEISARSDLFSAGTVLYWLVCGALPFMGPNPAALFRRIAEGRYDPVLTRRPQAGRAIARLIERCMARNPEDRPASALEVAESLRALLEEAGLVDPTAELHAFLKDPEEFQEKLTWRLVPAYLAQAERAWAARQSGRALDFLDRVLTLNEREETARALLRRIERGQRQGRAARVLVVAALVGGAGGLVFVLTRVPETPLAPDAAAPPSIMPATTASLGPAVALDPDGAVDATEPDAAPPPPLDAEVDARTRLVGRPPIRKPLRLDAALPPPQLITVRVGGQLKATEVFLDGVPRGYISDFDARGGIELATGRKYRFEFKNPACVETSRELDLRGDLPRAPEVLFDCLWKPAYLRVDSNVEGMVSAGDGLQLGRTNRLLRVRMDTLERDLSITVSDEATQRVQTAVVPLIAGREKQIKLEF